MLYIQPLLPDKTKQKQKQTNQQNSKGCIFTVLVSQIPFHSCQAPTSTECSVGEDLSLVSWERAPYTGTLPTHSLIRTEWTAAAMWLKRANSLKIPADIPCGRVCSVFIISP